MVDLLLFATEQLAIGRAAGHQLAVGAGVDDPAVDDHRHRVGKGQRAAPVRDQDGGPVRGQAVQREVDRGLRGRIDGTRRVVQDQHPGIGDHGPGQRQPLPLPAGQGQPTLADHRVVAIWQGVDELVGLRGAGGGDDVGLVGIRTAVPDICPDGVGEQEGFFEDHAHRSPQVGEREAADVGAAQADAAVLSFVEPGQQQRDG